MTPGDTTCRECGGPLKTQVIIDRPTGRETIQLNAWDSTEIVSDGPIAVEIRRASPGHPRQGGTRR